MQQNRNIFSLDVIFFISVSYNHEYTLNSYLIDGLI